MDKIEKLNKYLKEVSEKFHELKNCGMDEEILIIYLRNKTKLSKSKIESVLNHTEEFFNKLVKEEFIGNL